MAREGRPCSAGAVGAAMCRLAMPAGARPRGDGREDREVRRAIEQEIKELQQRPAVREQDEFFVSDAVRSRVDPEAGVQRKVARLKAALLREDTRIGENAPRVATPPSGTAWARSEPRTARTLRQQQRRSVPGRGRSVAGRIVTQTPRQQRERASADAVVPGSPAAFGRLVHQQAASGSCRPPAAGRSAVRPNSAPAPSQYRWLQQPPPPLPSSAGAPLVSIATLRRQVASIYRGKAAADWPGNQLISISKVPQPFGAWCRDEFFGPRRFGKGDGVVERVRALLGHGNSVDEIAEPEIEAMVVADQRLLLFRQLVCDSATTGEEIQRALGAELAVAVLVSVCRKGSGVQLHDKPLPLRDVADCVSGACRTCVSQLQARGSQGSQAQDYSCLELMERLQAQGWLKGVETVQQLIASAVGLLDPLQRAEKDLGEIMALKGHAVANASWGEAAALKLKQEAAEAKLKREKGIKLAARSRGNRTGGPMVALDATLAFLLSSVCPVLYVEGLGVPSLGSKEESIHMSRLVKEPQVQLGPMSVVQVCMHVSQFYLYLAKNRSVMVANGGTGRKHRLRRITPLPDARKEGAMDAERSDIIAHVEDYFGSWAGRVRGRCRALLASFRSGLQVHSLQHRAAYVFGRLSAMGWSGDDEDLTITSNSAVRELGLDCVLALMEAMQTLRSGSVKAKGTGQNLKAELSKNESGSDNSSTSPLDKTKLHVKGLEKDFTNEKELEQLFSEFGVVANVFCRPRNTSKGSWALVTMQDVSGATKALAADNEDPGISIGNSRLSVRKFSRKKAEASTGAMRVLITKDKDHIGELIATRSVRLAIDRILTAVTEPKRVLVMQRDAPEMIEATKSLRMALQSPQRIVNKICACVTHLCRFRTGAVSLYVVADLFLQALMPTLRGSGKVEDEWSPALANWDRVSVQQRIVRESAVSAPMRLTEVHKTINSIYIANMKASLFVRVKEDADAKRPATTGEQILIENISAESSVSVSEWPTGHWGHPMDHYLTTAFFRRMFGVETIALQSAAAFAVGLADYGGADRKAHVFRLLAGLGISNDDTLGNGNEASEQKALDPVRDDYVTAMLHFAAEVVTSLLLEIQTRVDSTASTGFPQNASFGTTARSVIAVVDMLQFRLKQTHTALSIRLPKLDEAYEQLRQQSQAAQASFKMAASMLQDAQEIVHAEQDAMPPPRLEGTAAVEAVARADLSSTTETRDTKSEAQNGAGAFASIATKVDQLQCKADHAEACTAAAAADVRRLKARSAICEQLWNLVGHDKEAGRGMAGNVRSDYETLIKQMLEQLDAHVRVQAPAPKRYVIDECVNKYKEPWCFLLGSLQYELNIDLVIDMVLENMFPQLHKPFGALDNSEPIILPSDGACCGCVSCTRQRVAGTMLVVSTKNMRALNAAFDQRSTIDSIPEPAPESESTPELEPEPEQSEQPEPEPEPEPESSRPEPDPEPEQPEPQPEPQLEPQPASEEPEPEEPEPEPSRPEPDPIPEQPESQPEPQPASEEPEPVDPEPEEPEPEPMPKLVPETEVPEPKHEPGAKPGMNQERSENSTGMWAAKNALQPVAG